MNELEQYESEELYRLTKQVADESRAVLKDLVNADPEEALDFLAALRDNMYELELALAAVENGEPINEQE